MANTRVGEIGIHDGQHEILLRPSFYALSQLNDIDSLITDCFSALAKVENGLQPSQYDLCSCAAVLMACGMPDNRTDLTGEPVKAAEKAKWKAPARGLLQFDDGVFAYDPFGAFVISEKPISNGMRWKVGKIPVENLVVLANALISAGVIGDKAKARKSKAKSSAKFDPAEFVAVAVAHLGLQPESAWQLTMTEFQLLMDAKYPQKKPTMTPDEVRAAMQRCGIKLQS